MTSSRSSSARVARMAHAVDLLVDRGFLLDVGVGARDVGFRLVVVVIGDEIFDRVVGEERLELAVELRRQRLVRREDERRALRRLDHLGHGEGLAGAGDAEQHLRAVVALDAFDQFADRHRLVALRLEVGLDDEFLRRLRISPAAADGAASSGSARRIPGGPRAAVFPARARWRRRPSTTGRRGRSAGRRAAGGISDRRRARCVRLPSRIARCGSGGASSPRPSSFASAGSSPVTGAPV